MVLASNGGTVAAALRALRDGRAGSLSSGLHHARWERGSGYCTFNGLALAAQAALAAGAADVLILDLDAHCGGGTHALIAENPHIWQVDVSVEAFDHYEPGERTTLDLVASAADYLPTITQRLHDVQAQRFGLCIYNAGMDPHEDCPEGGLAGISEQHLREREQLVFDWCRDRRLPVAFVIAGGYLCPPRMDEARLVELHRLTLTAAARSDQVP
jgi:acetoin utilization deacetylase AcuC-like enzyme